MQIYRKLGWLAVWAACQAAQAGDLSPLSDFGTSTITRESTFLNQYGDFNLASVDQHLALPNLTGHYAEITQNGAHNVVRTLQEGDANRLRVLQAGSDNYANITQNGYRNSVDLAQSGSGSRFDASQTGDDNKIIGIQPSGSTALMIQTGNNNVIDIDQNVAGLTITIRQPSDGTFVRIR